MGKIVGAWGLQGELKIAPQTDCPRRYLPGNVLHVNGHPMTIVRSRKTGRILVVKLKGINDRSHAESLKSALLTIPETELEQLPNGSFYHFDIVNSSVWDEMGSYLGQVKEILETGANDVYVVDNDGQELLLPAVDSVVIRVNRQERKITVRVPQGLI